ncbi:hypothetical protein LTSEMIN_5605, partial [Salmonella enterica subsp. enterica serovar Minnesota str. A4-603]
AGKQKTSPFCAERAISARILMNLSMDQKLRSVYKLLLI